MNIRKIEYKVKPAFAARNRQNVEQVLARLRASEHTGLFYAVFNGDNETSFTHLVVTDGDGTKALTELPEFQQFMSERKESGCEEEPVIEQLNLIGSSGNFLGV